MKGCEQFVQRRVEMGIPSRYITQAFEEVISAGTACVMEKEIPLATADMLAVLLDATTCGDFSDAARSFARQFWELQQQGGVGAAVDEYRQLFTVLVEKFPALHGPLTQALDEENPYIGLLPPAPADLSANLSQACAVRGACGEGGSAVANTDAGGDEAPAPASGCEGKPCCGPNSCGS